MLKKLKVMKNEKGMTLIELLAVIVIIAIVAAIAIPAIGNIIENSRYNAVKSDAINVLNAANLYYTDNPKGEAATGSSAGADTTTSITVAQLVTADYLETAGEIPTDASVTLSPVPRELTSKAITVNGKTVAFTKATIDDINKDPQKGSQFTTGHVIGTPPVTTP